MDNQTLIGDTTSRMKSLYQKNAKYGMNFNQEQMASFQQQQQRKKVQRQQQQRKRMQQMKKMEQQEEMKRMQQMKKVQQQEEMKRMQQKKRMQQQRQQQMKTLQPQQAQQRQQVRTLLKELSALNPKYRYNGYYPGSDIMERTLPYAQAILQELSTRKLTQQQEEAVRDILSQKTSDYAFFKGSHQAFGDKYQSLEDFKRKNQSQQQYQRRKQQQRQMAQR